MDKKQDFSAIQGPDGKEQKITLTQTAVRGVYILEFLPERAGTYYVLVYVNGKQTSAAPHELQVEPVGFADKCFMESKPAEKNWLIGEPRTFTINVRHGGKGALNIVSNKELVTKLEKDDAYYTVTLTPCVEGLHQIAVLYGGIEIPNASFSFEAVVSHENGDRLVQPKENDAEKLLLRRSFRFVITSEYQFDKISAYVETPTRGRDVAEIKENGDESVTITYEPKECGSHLLVVLHEEIDMVGSPVPFYVSETVDGYVTAYGPGLSQAVVGEPACFTVCARGSPARDLSIAVEGVSKATIKCIDNLDGTCSVTWVPPVVGEYKVHVKLCEKPVAGSPFRVFASGETRKRAHLSYGSASEVTLNVASEELRGYSASIRSPSGIEEPCFIRKINSAHIGVSFTPREEGEYHIMVRHNGVIIPKSPFRVLVDKSQIGDASKVVVTGHGKTNAISQNFSIFTVDTTKAGFGAISVCLEGPSKAELNCTEAEKGVISFAYRPTEPGTYMLSIKFADAHVPGSPYTVVCTGEGLGSLRETASMEMKEAPAIWPGQEAVVNMQLRNALPMEITAEVRGPDGYKETAEITDIGSGLYRIKFKPSILGQHAVSLFSDKQLVSGMKRTNFLSL
ncbi:unnamed protein product [Gongylonema pulchrum]|uniref:Filamin-A n=1 Tax=Gongylonema pulchrum TaxID=637853 RepID=A0A183EE02_9BILA|nr:unnamed protein product [Gongylonema pulchrum]